MTPLTKQKIKWKSKVHRSYDIGLPDVYILIRSNGKRNALLLYTFYFPIIQFDFQLN